MTYFSFTGNVLSSRLAGIGCPGKARFGVVDAVWGGAAWRRASLGGKRADLAPQTRGVSRCRSIPRDVRAIRSHHQIVQPMADIVPVMARNAAVVVRRVMI